MIQEHIAFVKEQIKHYEKMAYKNQSHTSRCEVYKGVVNKLRALLRDMELCVESNAAAPAGDTVVFSSMSLSKLPAGFFSNPLALSPSDISGLPEDVIKELNISPSDRVEATIVELLNAAGGTLILDKLIAGLYHVTGEVHARNTLTAKLYRMAKKGLVYSVPRKKGMYTTVKPLEDVSVSADESDDSDIL